VTVSATAAGPATATAAGPATAMAVRPRPAALWGVELGVYEKALRSTDDFDDLFCQVRQAGFTSVDLSVDESPQRAARLAWRPVQRQTVRDAAVRQGVQVGGLCLSLHRKDMPGSSDPALRARAREVLRQGIDLCADLGVPILQLAGCFAHDEPAAPQARRRYVDCLRGGAHYASRRGVVLGIENVDGDDVCSITAALQIVRQIDSAWLALYPDIGNLVGHGLDAVAELTAGQGRMLALHVKDVEPGRPRRVPMGQGVVPWEAAFAELARQQWSGRMVVEMWNDDAQDSVQKAWEAREFITEKLGRAGIRVYGLPLARR
jgi:predicted hexulose-6-phosphate isomerase